MVSASGAPCAAGGGRGARPAGGLGTVTAGGTAAPAASGLPRQPKIMSAVSARRAAGENQSGELAEHAAWLSQPFRQWDKLWAIGVHWLSGCTGRRGASQDGPHYTRGSAKG